MAPLPSSTAPLECVVSISIAKNSFVACVGHATLSQQLHFNKETIGAGKDKQRAREPALRITRGLGLVAGFARDRTTPSSAAGPARIPARLSAGFSRGALQGCFFDARPATLLNP